MKVNSISGLTFYVEDVSRTAAFYDAIGFRRGKEEADRLTFYVNWFFATFIARDRAEDGELTKEDADPSSTGAGLFVYIKVDDVEEFFDGVRSLGLKPATEIREPTRGQREFVLQDPDGYSLVFFQKK